ncbi:MAG: SDR family oxidoreductase, partial [Methylobacterium sp.]
MANELTGKVAAITGGASGIGLECARAMLGAGATVFVVDRDEDGLAKAVADLGTGARALRVDITDPAEVAGMLPQILEEAGQLDVFHANAGSYIGGDLVDGDPAAFDRMLNLNINAVFRGVHAVLPHMISRGTGDVIVTSSVAGHQAIPWEPIYSASKHAVQAFVHATRRQVAK